MMSEVNRTDPHAINGKFPRPEKRYDLVVIGAGPSGIAAALEGAALEIRIRTVSGLRSGSQRIAEHSAIAGNPATA